MPIYEYRCAKCGTLEVFQRINDDALTRCPTCRSRITKLISRSSFQLKGTGWYVTDYAGKGRDGEAKEPAKKDTAAASDSSQSSTAGNSDGAGKSDPKSTSSTKTGDKSSTEGSKAA